MYVRECKITYVSPYNSGLEIVLTWLMGHFYGIFKRQNFRQQFLRRYRRAALLQLRIALQLVPNGESQRNKPLKWSDGTSANKVRRRDVVMLREFRFSSISQCPQFQKYSEEVKCLKSVFRKTYSFIQCWAKRRFLSTVSM